MKRYRRRGLEAFPTQDLTGTPEDPAVFELEALTRPKSVQIKGRIDPRTGEPQENKVMDVHVVNTSVPEIVKKDDEYSLWFTTVLTKEMDENLPDVQEGTKFLLCYYGRYQKGKRPKSTDPHLFRVIPQPSAGD